MMVATIVYSNLAETVFWATCGRTCVFERLRFMLIRPCGPVPSVECSYVDSGRQLRLVVSVPFFSFLKFEHLQNNRIFSFDSSADDVRSVQQKAAPCLQILGDSP